MDCKVDWMWIGGWITLTVMEVDWDVVGDADWEVDWMWVGSWIGMRIGVGWGGLG